MQISVSIIHQYPGKCFVINTMIHFHPQLKVSKPFSGGLAWTLMVFAHPRPCWCGDPKDIWTPLEQQQKNLLTKTFSQKSSLLAFKNARVYACRFFIGSSEI
ncbi:uncharacterized protein LOC117172982 [Belonocnema kinseyi]|uniref:uncharacterized protein LOC117172982 n=1 Tax=Belonocnema kinseyi TaxID=2817044 RepID=UPI00143D5562|nr:uncharacterized protein LOC117172982 [Belonocnema kinseyi]